MPRPPPLPRLLVLKVRLRHSVHWSGSKSSNPGATLKQIRDQTSVRIDIPRKDSLSPTNGNGHANGALSSGKVTPSQGDEDDDEESTVPVTVTGPQPLAYEAQALLNQIISSKTSRTTQRVRDIPAHLLPFVTARRATFQSAANGGDVNLTLNTAAREITVSGDREAVILVVETIKAAMEDLKTGLTSLKISLPKRQHRLLAGKSVDEIMAKSKCSVVIGKSDDPSEEVTVWGQAGDLPSGLGAVMEKANSQYIKEFTLPAPISFSKQVLTYMTRIGYHKTVGAAHPGVLIHTPSTATIEKAQTLHLDMIGEKPAVDAAASQISELVAKLTGATMEIPVDWLVHRVITGKNAKKCDHFLYCHIYLC